MFETGFGHDRGHSIDESVYGALTLSYHVRRQPAAENLPKLMRICLCHPLQGSIFAVFSSSTARSLGVIEIFSEESPT
jgi:hypothetical protein